MCAAAPVFRRLYRCSRSAPASSPCWSWRRLRCSWRPRPVAPRPPRRPSHLAPYGLDWLNYIDPQDLPPSRYAVCLVDSGVAVTPDTPPDDPNGPILRRLAVDGGSGEPQGTSDAQMHGTRMAMTAVAPQNDWGTIGAWTGGRIISVRAMVEGEETFRAEAYQQGIDKCLSEIGRHDVAAINLSLSCTDCSPSESEASLFDERVASAHKLGISVVVAAGNNEGSVGYPANRPGVIAVGAGDSDGRACPYAAKASGLLLAPACPVETADPATGLPRTDPLGGSSASSVIASSALAAIRSLVPHVERKALEHWMNESATEADDALALNGDAFGELAGLKDVTARARARQPSSPSAPTPTGTPAPHTGSDSERTQTAEQPLPSESGRAHRSRLTKPRLRRVRWGKGRLVLQLSSPDRGASLGLVALCRRSEFSTDRIRRRVAARGTVSMRLPCRPDRLQLRLRPLPGSTSDRRSSRPMVLRRHGRNYR